MFKSAKPFFIICETPLHAGSGNDIGIVDLPIQRERHTDFPKIEGSGLKGGIREVFEELVQIQNGRASLIKSDSTDRLKTIFNDLLDQEWKIKTKKNGQEVEEVKKDKDGNTLIKFNEAISLSFGPEQGDEHAGALGFTDARLLLFPVKSMKGVFAWVTCPKALERFKNDMKLCGVEFNFDIPDESSAPQQCSLYIKDNNIILEEYTFQITNKDDKNLTEFANWLSKKLLPAGNEYSYWREKVKEDIVVLSDDDFRDFVNLSTEVITRTRINNETGTVQSGALFTEEYLPSESILYSLALASPIFKKKDKEKGVFKQKGREEYDLVIEFFTKGLPEVMQLGGNATTGKGIVRTKVLEVKNG